MSEHEKVFNAFQALQRIQWESSTLSKHAILQENKDNEVMKCLLYSAYNPYLQFYIKKIPVVKANGIGSYDAHYAQFLELLGKLSHREVTGNAAIDAVSEFLGECDEAEQLWYTRVISKDLKIGLADKGINKVFPKLIPTYEVMLADKVDPNKILDDPKTQKALPELITIQYKVDGYRLNIHRPSDSSVIIRTRNGKFVSGYNDLEESAQKLPSGYVYDGEVVAPELLNWISENIDKGGVSEANRDLFSEVMSHAFSKEQDKKGVFIVFDVVPINDWVLRNCKLSYHDRYSLLQKLVQPLHLPNIIVIPTSRTYHKSNMADLQEILEQFHKHLDAGWEGTMIKDESATYQWKRTKALLKLKLMDTADLTVLEMYEGTGKYKGMMGGVFCEYKGNKLGVGSGFTDEQRQTFWDNPNAIVGNTIEVAYQAETTNKHGQKSLSFPIFKQVRKDK